MSRPLRLFASSVPLAVAALLALSACGGSGNAHADRVSVSASPTGSASPVPSSGPLTAETAETIVSRAVIGNEDLGPEWRGGLIEAGSTLDDPTLEEPCDDVSFKSDADRLARYQTDISSETAEISNEVVGYRSGGAKRALDELAASIQTCNGKTVTIDGDLYRVTLEKVTPKPAWGSDALAVRLTSTNTSDPTDTVTGLSIFQRQGDILTAVYEWDGNVSQELLFTVADLASKRLSEAIRNTPRSTASIPVPTGTPLDRPDGAGEDEDDPNLTT